MKLALPVTIEENTAGIWLWDAGHDWPGYAPRLVCKVGGVGDDIERDRAKARKIASLLNREVLP